MRDDYRGRSPDRGRHRPDFDNGEDFRDFRASHGHHEQDDHYRSRHDYSRSPPRQNYYDDQRDTPPRRRRQDMDTWRDRDESHDRHDERYRRNDDFSPPRHRSRHHWDDHNASYDGMYDDARRAGGSHGGRGRSRSPRRRYRSRSRSRTRDAGKPTDTVIIEGLPNSISTAELRKGLLASSIAAEFPSIDVRTSSSKGNRRAFVQFEAVGHATAFVKEHFPKLLIELQHSTDDVPDGKFEAFIHYARNRDEGDARSIRGADWTCPQCNFSNFATRESCKVCGTAQSAQPNWEQGLTGAADVADGAEAASQILVIHPLASFVTEDMLAKDAKLLEKTEETSSSSSGPSKLKSTAPGADASRFGARPGSLHRVFLMRAVESGESFKYGFAEFWTLEDAAAAVQKFRMSRSFTVAGCAVTVAPTHMGVFLPEERELTPQIEHTSFCPLFNTALRVRYRDPHVFPSQLLVTQEPPTANGQGGSGAVDGQDGDGKKTKKRKGDASLASSAAKKPVAMAGQMAVWQRKHDELRETNGDAASDDASAHAAKLDANKGPIKISLNNSIKFGASAAIDLGAKKQASPSNATGADDARNASPNTPEPVSQDGSSAREETYLDRNRLMCLICMRKYKSLDECDIHEKSRNHKTAMEDEEKVKAALPRLEARDKRAAKLGQEDESQTTQYRDRAKERRDIYNQPDKPKPQSNKPKGGDAPKKDPAKKDAEDKSSKPVASKGAGMLAKMGWTTGSGLGAHGDGRTDAIATNAYQEGVGLGAEGGNLGDAVELAEKKTKNRYSDYLNTVQDKARARYNQMN